MQKQIPFQPIGNTILVAGATTAPTGVTTVTTGVAAEGCIQFRVHNAGAVTAHYAFGADGATAKANAVVPTGDGSNAKASYPLPAGAVELITAPRDTYWSALTASSTASVFITPGVGV